MTLSRLLSAALILCLILIAGCGQGGNITAVGVTGGSDDGYGSRTDIAGTRGDDNKNQIDQNLIGTWRADFAEGAYQLLIFNTDGTYEISLYYLETTDVYYGIYSASGSLITFDGTDIFSYTVNANTLTIDFGDYTQTFYRV
ncbi:hypothetical protein GF337_13020 [candidate division KSB1 bacterium]|nr:hypothetical protein [candidate division KSB1 bacterium]